MAKDGTLTCDECRAERRNLVCHLTASGELLQLCPKCMSRRYM